MNLRQLRYFVAIAEEKHFGRAARRLRVSQPPLSQQLKAFEEELACSLFTRTTRRVELTPAGRALLPRAQAILAELEAAARDTQRVHRGEAGRLSISFVGSATYSLLPGVVRAVRKALPQVTLTIESERLSPAQQDALIAQHTDLAVLSLAHTDAVSPLLRIEAERREPLVVALSKQHRLARVRTLHMRDLCDVPFLMHPDGGRSILHQKVRELCHQAGFRPRIAQEVGETVTAVSLAAAGLGVAILPRSVRALRITGAVYRPLSDDDATMMQVLVCRHDDDSAVLAKVLAVARPLIAGAH